jgi:lysophospholipase L1-like esterase
LQRRVQRDVLSRKPALVIIYVGINDVWHREKEPVFIVTPETFTKQLEDVTNRITGYGAKIILCTPALIGEKKIGLNKFDSELDAMCKVVRTIAHEHHYVLCDLRKGFAKYIGSHNNKQEVDSGVLTCDGVHLNEQGNLLVAKLLLKTMGVKPDKSFKSAPSSAKAGSRAETSRDSITLCSSNSARRLFCN